MRSGARPELLEGSSAAPPSRGQLLLPIALGITAFLLAWGTLHYGFYTHHLLLDTPLYEHYGDAILKGRVPYRDFHVEYPPGSLPVFAIPSALAGAGAFGLYSRLFEGMMGLCGMAVAGSVAAVVARRGSNFLGLAAPVALASLGMLALGPVVLSRFDLWPAALTVTALAALVFGRTRLSFALLGVAFAAKVYPLVLLPLMLTYVWRREGRRGSLVSGAIWLSTALVTFLPFLVLSAHGVWASISEQASRPLQIESVGASFLLAAHQVSGIALVVRPSHGSDNLVGTLPHVFALSSAVIQLTVILWLWVGFARGPADTERLLRFCAAAVCAFVAFGKVLSPQYLVWLIPLVPLVRGRRGAVAGLLLVLAMVLTQLWFPYRYLDLVYSLDPAASWLVFARDVSLVALVLLLAGLLGRANASKGCSGSVCLSGRSGH